MKLQRSTWTLLSVAVVLSGVVLATELSRWRSPTTTPNATTGTALFTVAEADIQSFQIEAAADTLSFNRDATGTWQMTAPTAQVANAGTIAFLLNLIATARGQSPQTVTAAQLAEFGLADPWAIVTFTTQAGESFQLALGDQNFNGEQRYAIAQPVTTPPASPTAITIQLVPNTFAAAVDRPVADWVGLPVPPVPSPSPTPTAPPPAP